MADYEFKFGSSTVPAKARSKNLQNITLNGGVIVNGSTSTGVGTSDAIAAQVVNNYVTNNYYADTSGGKGHYKGRITIADLNGLTSTQIENNDMWLVYSSGSDATGWSQGSTFVLNNKTYPDETYVQRVADEWQAVDNDFVDVEQTLQLNYMNPDLFLISQTYEDTSYWNLTGETKPGIKIAEVLDYKLGDIYNLNFHRTSDHKFGTPYKTLFVPYAYRETVDGVKTYHGGALTDTDYKFLMEMASGGGSTIDIQDYIDTSWSSSPTNDRIPSSKLVYDGLTFLSTQFTGCLNLINNCAKKSDLDNYVSTDYLSSNYFNKAYLTTILTGLKEDIPTESTVASWGFVKANASFKAEGNGNDAEIGKWKEIAYFSIASNETIAHSQIFAVRNTLVAVDKQFGILSVFIRTQSGALTHWSLNTDNPSLENKFMAIYNQSTGRFSIYAKQLSNSWGNSWNGWSITTISDSNKFTQGAATAVEEPTAPATGGKLACTCYTQQVTANTVENWGFAKAANIPTQFPTSDYVPVLGLTSGAVMRLHFSKLFTPLCFTYWSTTYNNDLCVVGAKLTLYITTDVDQDSQILICTKGGTGSYCYVINNEGMTPNKIYKYELTVTDMQTTSAGYSYPNNFAVVRTVIE